jgi:glutathione S-transferase
MLPAMIKLHGSGVSRWVKPYWLLQELEVPFEPITVSIAKGETRTPEYLALNPFAKVPVLEDGELCLFESAAICTYLADKYSEKGLIPRVGTADRARHDQWMSFVISELEQPLWRIIKHSFLYPEDKRSPADVTLAREDFRALTGKLDALIDGEFLVGNRFSVADICATYTVRWSMTKITSGGENLLDQAPKLKAYAVKHMERPAFPRQFYQG